MFILSKSTQTRLLVTSGTGHPRSSRKSMLRVYCGHTFAKARKEAAEFLLAKYPSYNFYAHSTGDNCCVWVAELGLFNTAAIFVLHEKV